MKVAVIQFPGSNCDQDACHAFADVLGVPTSLVWHKERNLADYSAVVLPGGFSFGDYLRCGAIARFSPILSSVAEFAANGGRVLGICNGFQILCESRLLPGALIRNDCLEFRCRNQELSVEDSTDHFSCRQLGDRLSLPIAHGEGNYRIDPQGLEALQRNNQILFRYSAGDRNPNGSIERIAGVRNKEGNVFGMMPHPERAVEPIHPTEDGVRVLRAFLGGLEA